MNTEPTDYYLKTEFYKIIKEDSRVVDFILSESCDGIWYWDLEKRENEWVSPTFWKTLGFDPATRKNLISEWADLVYQEDIELAFKMIDSYLDDPSCPYDQIVRYRHKNGSTVWLKCRAFAIRDTNGKPIRLLGAHSDVSSTMNLRLENKIRNNIMEAVSNPIFIKDTNLRYTDFNMAFQNLLGLKSSEIIGKTVHEVTKKEYSNEYHVMDNLLMTSDETSQVYESRVLTKDGSIKNVVINKKLIKDDDNNPYAIVGVITDITDLKKKELELIEAKNKAEAANVEKSRFVANMSHEIRTPLNGVVGILQVLEMTDITDQQSEYIKIARESSEILLKVIDDILSYSKIEAGKVEFEELEFSLIKLVNNTVKMFEHLVKEKNLLINTYYEKELPDLIVGDSLRLKQIITNLLSNAVKFTYEGEINIFIKKSNELINNKIVLEFKITDSGIGIPSSKLDSIFSSFTQADSSNTREYGGTGLGLAICKGLVERMNGSIWAESEVGRGSAFYFNVAFGLSESRNKKVEDYSKIKNSFQSDGRIHLLVVEDNKISSMVLKEVIMARGWEATLARDGIEGLECYKKGQYDGIIMDIEMPNLDGYQTTGIIRQLEENDGSHTPIIALTALAQEGDREKCLEAGMDDYLTKPLDADRFYKMVEHWIKGGK